jgi:hypothetical protein
VCFAKHLHVVLKCISMSGLGFECFRFNYASNQVCDSHHLQRQHNFWFVQVQMLGSYLQSRKPNYWIGIQVNSLRCFGTKSWF